ncbi:hypothetical protein L1887_35690 [Cichorium endivia]|nr:hypothetical protein L1887_35690 [Cichorium endivia]
MMLALWSLLRSDAFNLKLFDPSLLLLPITLLHHRFSPLNTPALLNTISTTEVAVVDITGAVVDLAADHHMGVGIITAEVVEEDTNIKINMSGFHGGGFLCHSGWLTNTSPPLGSIPISRSSHGVGIITAEVVEEDANIKINMSGFHGAGFPCHSGWFTNTSPPLGSIPIRSEFF